MGQFDRLELTEDEAFALLALCMTSEMALDSESEHALHKLAAFCKKARNHPIVASGELCEAG